MLDLDKGKQLAGRYTLLQPLGGNDAQVWLARDKLTGASMVLKASPAAQRLRDEWQLGIRMMHAHIVRAFEFHDEADFAFFSQQHIDGPDLSAVAGQSAADVLAPVGLIADALRYVHGKGVVHRDIKASNVLLDKNGAPYLLDFGIACKIGESRPGQSDIASSPQSLAGESAQPSDDIFALGGLVYELLTNASAYSSADSLADIRNKVPGPVTQCNGEPLPTDVTALLAEMLHKDAARRPTAEDVAERLQQAGFVPGVANITGVSAPSVAALREERIVATARVSSPSATSAGETTATNTAKTRGGVGSMGVGLALATLLVLLVGVVFFLPNKLSEQGDGAALQDLDETGQVAPAVEITDEQVAALRNQGGTVENEVISFSENTANLSGLDNEGLARLDAEGALGELLSALQVLEGRAADRWAPMEHRRSKELYAAGDKLYLEKDFLAAKQQYLDALAVLQPLYARIEPTFDKAYSDAVEAFDAGDRLESLQFYELAVAITPNHSGAVAGYQRAKNLEAVLSLVDQGIEYEEDLELAAAERSFSQAVELDPLWEPAYEGLQRVQSTRTKMEFDLRMSDGFVALAENDYLAARAAFRVAQKLLPESSEPADGLLQVEQGLRLNEIQTLEQEVRALERDEHWDAVVKTYEEILKVDSTLSFASDGLTQAQSMSALHARLDNLIAEPDKLSAPQRMQSATQLVVSITTRENAGPRLQSQRDELSRLLRRAATPLTVPLLSDNVTEVTIYRVGQLGRFMRTEVNLRPGNYVAVGIRPGYRDVRQEFRVAPEISMEPIVVRCEEQI